MVAVILGVAIVKFRSLNANSSFEQTLLTRNHVTLAPGVHLLGELAPSVAYAIETSQGIVLIDSGLEAKPSKLLEQLSKLGLDSSQICAVLLTHVHGDHTQGARYLREMMGAKIYAGQGDCEPMRDGGPREAIFSTFPMDGYVVHSTPVDVELKGGEELVFGDTTISVLATPGHTPGSTCYLLHKNDQSFLFGGDTISSLIADLGTYSAYLAPRFRGNARDYLQSLQKLRSMPKPDLVLPGHPNEQNEPHSPRLSEEMWHSVLDRGIRDLKQLIARHDADGQDFLDGNPKELLTGLHYLGDYQSRAVYVLNTAKHRLLFDAPGDDGLVTFVTKQMKAAGLEMPPVSAVLMTSADPANTGGLRAVTDHWHCPIVAAQTAHEAIRLACSDSVALMTPDEVGKFDEFKTQVIPLGDRGDIAYFFNLQGQRVLVSGNFPSTLSRSSVADVNKLIRSLGGDMSKHADTLREFRDIQPNLWLPAKPLNGQNANLYDTQWDDCLFRNLQLLQNIR